MIHTGVLVKLKVNKSKIDALDAFYPKPTEFWPNPNLTNVALTFLAHSCAPVPVLFQIFESLTTYLPKNTLKMSLTWQTKFEPNETGNKILKILTHSRIFERRTFSCHNYDFCKNLVFDLDPIKIYVQIHQRISREFK